MGSGDISMSPVRGRFPHPRTRWVPWTPGEESTLLQLSFYLCCSGLIFDGPVSESNSKIGTPKIPLLSLMKYTPGCPRPCLSLQPDCPQSHLWDISLRFTQGDLFLGTCHPHPAPSSLSTDASCHRHFLHSYCSPSSGIHL